MISVAIKPKKISISFHLIVGEIMSGCVKIVIGGVNVLCIKMSKVLYIPSR